MGQIYSDGGSLLLGPLWDLACNRGMRQWHAIYSRVTLTIMKLRVLDLDQMDAPTLKQLLQELEAERRQMQAQNEQAASELEELSSSGRPHHMPTLLPH